MIYINSIELTSLKGIDSLRCEFDDFTVLAGLNNSGKTTLLQGVYLLFASLRPISEHKHITHQNPDVRSIALQNALSPLGLRDTTWLFSHVQPDITGTIVGEFSNGLSVELGVIRNSTTNFLFTVSHANNDLERAITSLSDVTANILTPPGDVPTGCRAGIGSHYVIAAVA